MSAVRRLYAVMLLVAASGAMTAPVRAEAPKPEKVQGSARVEEGDLLSVGGSEVKLHAIDAPDKGQRCTNRRGVEYDCFLLSKMALERLTEGKIVECTLRPGQAKPRIGVCRVGTQDLGATMVRAGWALAYRRISPDYASFEARAMSSRTGMWGGRVEPPWLWRDRQLAGGGAKGGPTPK